MKPLCDGAWAVPATQVMKDHGNFYFSCSLCGEPTPDPIEGARQNATPHAIEDNDLRSLYPISAMRPAVQDEVIALVEAREEIAERRGAKPYRNILIGIAETMEEDRIMLRTAASIRQALAALSTKKPESQ